MTKDPKCALSSHTMEEAAQQMRDENIGSVLVCDIETRKLIGIVTDRDIVVKGIAQGADPKVAIIETIMTQNPLCCDEEEGVGKAMDLMAEHQVRRLPIVNGEGHLVGIISQGDIATRVHEAKKTGKIVDQISQPPSEQYLQEHSY